MTQYFDEQKSISKRESKRRKRKTQQALRNAAGVGESLAEGMDVAIDDSELAKVKIHN